MPKLKKRNYQDFLDEHRLHCKVINDDVILFRRHNRLYRLINLTNNRIPGELFVLINANTTSGSPTALIFGSSDSRKQIWLH